MGDSKMRWLSWTRVWKKFVGVGIFLGWDEHMPVLALILGRHVLTVGRHSAAGEGKR